MVTAAENRLVCHGLTCFRGGRPILRDVAFCLGAGGFLLLKGANGSGKTTLLNILGGLRAPEAGHVLWNGAPVPANTAFKQELTYIGHTNAIKKQCSVLENVRFWGKARGTEAMIPAALRYFDMEEKADVPVGALSAGWQRRVALTRLLLSRGNLWLLDEPTNFLDAEAIALVSNLIETRVKLGGMVIAASHTMGSAFASHVLELEDFAA